jgi:hypothetical protein
MEALGEVRLLQRLTKDGLLALEKEVNPPLWHVGNAGFERAIDTSPGALNPVNNVMGATPAISSIYNVRANLEALEMTKEKIKMSIKEYFYNDLFLAISRKDKNMTAREVMELDAEKMMLLGPVLDRLRSELFQPLTERVFGIANRRGLIPIPPEEIQGKELKIEFISILAQAQKQAGMTAINQTVGFIGQLAQADPTALDKLNIDEVINQVAEINGSPPMVIRSEEEVAQIREARAQQQAQMQQMAMAKEMAGLAATGGQAAESISKASAQSQNPENPLGPSQG